MMWLKKSLAVLLAAGLVIACITVVVGWVLSADLSGARLEDN